MKRNRIIFAVLFVLFLGSYCQAGVEEGILAYDKKDFQTAFSILKPLADQNNAKAMHYIGKMYFKGEGVAKDRSKSVSYWQKAAGIGYAVSAYNMGICCKFGYGISKDTKKALEWFEYAVELGDTPSAFQIGKLYRDGHLGTTDFSRARIWFEKAARKGNESAMNDLAVMYQKGTHIPKDLPKAYAWFKLAAEKGNKKAPKNLSITKSLMNSAQIQQGEQIAAQFKGTMHHPPAPPKPAPVTPEPAPKPVVAKVKPKPAPEPAAEPKPAKPKPAMRAISSCFPNLDKALAKGYEICAQSNKAEDRRKWCELGCKQGAEVFEKFYQSFTPNPDDPRSVCLQIIRAYRWKTNSMEKEMIKNGMDKREAYYRAFGLKVYSQAVQKLDNINK